MDQHAKRAVTAQWLAAQGLDLIGQSPEELDWVHAQFGELIESNQTVETMGSMSVKQ